MTDSRHPQFHHMVMNVDRLVSLYTIGTNIVKDCKVPHFYHSIQ